MKSIIECPRRNGKATLMKRLADSANGDIRIDCALGIELKAMRVTREITLMEMSKDIGWRPSKLSGYESNIGSLTDKDDARVIEDYLSRQGWAWSGDAIELSNKSVEVDLTEAKAIFREIIDDLLIVPTQEKLVSQADFEGQPKRYKWVVANGEGIKKYFINKPRLIDHINGVYRTDYLGDKVTPAFRKKHRGGIGLEGGYKCLANIANGDGILRRKDQ